MNQEIQSALEEIALKRAIPFCYNCYIKCPTGRCEKCFSDDLMLSVDSVGCDWGTQWIIEHILETELEAVNFEEQFEQSVRDCYPEETTVGWITVDTVTVMKEQDPVGWRCALSEYESQEESEGNIVSFDNGSKYYEASDIEDFIRKNLE